MGQVSPHHPHKTKFLQENLRAHVRSGCAHTYASLPLAPAAGMPQWLGTGGGTMWHGWWCIDGTYRHATPARAFIEAKRDFTSLVSC